MDAAADAAAAGRDCSAAAGRLDRRGRLFPLRREHILLGFDHLLFLLALLLIARGPWLLFKTITAFTVAHSITLALATLGFVHVPSKPVEAVIALSIVFVAVEIVHASQAAKASPSRAPWIVAFAFGLLHGFGFAGALSEVGLPPGHIPVALLFFNLGVEYRPIAVRRRGAGRRGGQPAVSDCVAALGKPRAGLCNRQRCNVLGFRACCNFLTMREGCGSRK